MKYYSLGIFLCGKNRYGKNKLGKMDWENCAPIEIFNELHAWGETELLSRISKKKKKND